MINQGVIQNQDGGLIRIGSEQGLPDGLLFDTQNTFANVGQLINENGASIENYGTLVNAGLIDNQAGASFVSTGVLHNTESGEMQFADGTTLEGFVINNADNCPSLKLSTMSELEVACLRSLNITILFYD